VGCIVAAVDHIRRCPKELDRQHAAFAERLEFLRKRWPPEVTGIAK
jgi:hypothetical protein